MEDQLSIMRLIIVAMSSSLLLVNEIFPESLSVVRLSTTAAASEKGVCI